MALTKIGKARKGKKFSSEEELQLCESFIHISYDPVEGASLAEAVDHARHAMSRLGLA
jgi:hypothetical protein